MQGDGVLELLRTTVRFLAQGGGRIRYAPAGAGNSRNITLRMQGIIGFVALVVYVAVAGLLIAKQRNELLQIIQEVERVHLKEDALTKASSALAHAVLAVNEAYFETQATPRFGNLAVGIEAVQAGLLPLLTEYPALAIQKERVDRNVAGLRSQPARAGLLDLRDSLHTLVSELDTVTRGVREFRKKLSDSYRIVYDSITVIAVTMGLAGVILFGGLTALFFSRLAWDLKTLEQRARQVVQGYRGEPLQVTRSDEVGGLMGAVNQMQSNLRSREQQLEVARQQRFHQEKMATVGSLAAAIAHEINNPIAAISGVAQEMCSAQQQRQCRAHGAPCAPELILEQAQRIARISRQVSDLAAPQSAQAQWVDVNGLVRRICNFVSYDQRLRGVSIDLDMDSQLPAYYGVPDAVSQIIMNLLLNAADAVASPAERMAHIGLSTRFEGNALVLAVQDNGSGMSDAIRARAFDEGYTTKADGSGMGLFICKSLIETCGGTIELKSTPGIGSTVQVRLPAQSEPALEPTQG
jgi:signal transduction histidine kinase